MYGKGKYSGLYDRKGCKFSLTVPEIGVSVLCSVYGICFFLMCCGSKEKETPQT